ATTRQAVPASLQSRGAGVPGRARAVAGGAVSLSATGLGAGQEREDPTDQLLVILDVVLEDPELLELDQIHGAEGLSGTHRAEGDGLEARAPALRPVRHEDEVEVRPLPARHVEDRALAALVLDR